MATLWERIQSAMRAAAAAWRGEAALSGMPVEFWLELTDADRRRNDLYRQFWNYYRGHHKTPLKTAPGEADDNLIINDSRRIVDKGLAFLFGKELEWQLEEGETTPAEEALDAIWQANRKMTLLNDVGLNGAICGTYYVLIAPREGLPPRLVNLDPAMVFPRWNPDDVDEMWVYELRWQSAGTVQRQIFSLDDGGNWQYWKETLRGGRWEVTEAAQVWPFGWPPIHHGKNLPNPNEFYGLSDLEDADMNDAINFVASNTNRTVRRFANPILYGSGFGDSKIDLAKVVRLPTATSTLAMLQMAGEMTGSREYLRQLRHAYYQTARVPMMDADTLALGAQSGFALRVLHGDLLEKTETKRRLYGDFIIELNRRLLEMDGYGAENEVALYWPDPLPTNIIENNQRDQFELDNQLVSRETVQTRRGIDTESEGERMAADQSARTSLGEMLLAEFTRGGAGMEG
jgi:hypothetical protein